MSIIAAVLIILAAVAVRSLLDSPDTEQGQASTTTTPSSTTATPAGRTCGEVKGVDADGQPVPAALLAQVRAIHEAACRPDPRALLDTLTAPGHELPEPTLEQLRADPGARATLALTLETAPRTSQGGHTYCAPTGAAAVFGRGTHDRPGGLTAFTTRPTGMTEGLCPA
ncbi:hypothetical protein [Saccharothrix luteola]|uniref:hypothetical protein n=1 Tax=Saccharothrix luteola TaxID=2893018 RepID=UPI001E3C1F20|nr:hypothetical protein [Saccharothrix luteola]